MPSLCNHFPTAEYLRLCPVYDYHLLINSCKNAWFSSTVVSIDCIVVSKNEHITSIYGGYWEKQTLISNIYKITIIASVMKESLWSFESLW